jgi:hypothetical protein
MAARTKTGKKVTRSSSARRSASQATLQARPEDQPSANQASPSVAPPSLDPPPSVIPPKRIRLITNGPWSPESEAPQTTMGRAIRPFAKPAQSGTYAPFAVAQARRGR